MQKAIEQFENLIVRITSDIAGLPVEPGLEPELNAGFAPGSPVFDELEKLCHQGVHDGWLCAREHGGIKFGRIIKPSDKTADFSVDVVEMENIAGPYHVHPGGEIDMIMPLDDTARFDGAGRGWKVYGPGSGHRPTVTDGRALILYLLPEGAIDFKAEEK